MAFNYHYLFLKILLKWKVLTVFILFSLQLLWIHSFKIVQTIDAINMDLGAYPLRKVSSTIL